MTPTGLDVLIAREGEKLTAYKDSQGVWTIGVGHTTAGGVPAVKPGMQITADESRDILSRDLKRFEDAIRQNLKVTCTDNELDALASIAFNVGPKFAKSTCIQRLNKGDRIGAANAILMWKIPPEIITRRRAERMQFLTPYRVHMPVARLA